MNTTVTFEGNLADPPELRYTPTGRPVVEFVVIVNRRRENEAGEWVDETPTSHKVSAFGSLATNTAASLDRGSRVLVHGWLITESWADKTTGETRYRTKVHADAIGVSLRWAIATPAKTDPETGHTTVQQPND